MLGRYARQLGIALLAVCLSVSPVLGALPRCCQTGARAGSGSCCCGPQVIEEEPRSCCQPVERSCCSESNDAESNDAESNDAEAVDAKAVDETATVTSAHTLGAAPCNCKARTQPSAMTRGQQRVEQYETPAFELAAPLADEGAAFIALLGGRHLHQAAPPGISLHKVHCRWTV